MASRAFFCSFVFCILCVALLPAAQAGRPVVPQHQRRTSAPLVVTPLTGGRSLLATTTWRWAQERLEFGKQISWSTSAVTEEQATDDDIKNEVDKMARETAAKDRAARGLLHRAQHATSP